MVARSGIGIDECLCWFVGLAQKPPMPPGAQERFVQALQVLDDWQAIHDAQPFEVRCRSSCSRRRDSGWSHPTRAATSGYNLSSKPDGTRGAVVLTVPLTVPGYRVVLAGQA
jgi:hypothetical protein